MREARRQASELRVSPAGQHKHSLLGQCDAARNQRYALQTCRIAFVKRAIQRRE